MNSKLKIGVLTIPYAQNYGSVLQAYAMLKNLSRYGEVSLVNYISPFLIGRYKIWNVDRKTIKTAIISFCASAVYFPILLRKRYKYNDFCVNYLKLDQSPTLDAAKINQEKYDLIIVGSDQIWNTRITHYDKAFFLDFIKGNKKKIAISPSLGYSNRDEEELDFYRNNMYDFDFVGIRERTDEGFVRENIKKDAKVTTIYDPTLYVSSDEWAELASSCKRQIKDDYILVYAFGISEEIRKTINQLKCKQDLPVYVVADSWKKKNNDGYYYLSSVGPIEFLNLIKNSSYVVTNSFHGTVFSLIFEKEFFSIPYKGTESRVLSLLKDLNLEDRIIIKNDKKIKFEAKIDYFKIKQELEKIKKETFNILDDLFGDCGWAE